MLRRAWSFLVLLFLIFPIPVLFAQEEAPELPPIDIEWLDDVTVYTRGDRTFTITLGTIFPTVFWGDEAEDRDGGLSRFDHNINMGGTGTLAFNFFLSPNIFIGGELTGMFASTQARNMLYIIPFGFRIGYQFVMGSFEFPISLMVGAAPQMYLENNYFGLIMKPGASVFWRFNADWSFGLNAVWWFVPQWRPRDNGPRAFGNFITATLSARYHF